MLGILLCLSLVLFVALSTIMGSMCIIVRVLPRDVIDTVTTEQQVNDMLPICIRVTKKIIRVINSLGSILNCWRLYLQGTGAHNKSIIRE